MNALEKLNAEINKLEAKAALLDDAIELLRSINVCLEVYNGDLRSCPSLPGEIEQIVDRYNEILTKGNKS